MSTTAVFIDGGPLYDIIQARACSTDLDYATLIRNIAAPGDVVSSTFYIAPLPAQAYPQRAERVESILTSIASQGITVRIGRTEIFESAWIDRGIEAMMAADITKAAHDADVDTILVVSQRVDLVPVVEAAREVGKTVHVAFFVNYVIDTPTELSYAAAEFREITNEDIVPLIQSGPAPYPPVLVS